MAGVQVVRLMRASAGFAALFALLVALVLSTGSAQAQQPASWRISSASGTVRVTEFARPPFPAKVGAVVRNGAVIATGKDGFVTVVGPHGRMDVSPNSRVTLKKDAQGFSRVLQDAGSILYQIDKRSALHFQVDAPLMTAVVKGTTFKIEVTPISTLLAVSEGLVEARARQGPARLDVSAGRMALILQRTPTVINSYVSLQIRDAKSAEPDAATQELRGTETPSKPPEAKLAPSKSQKSDSRAASPGDAKARDAKDNGERVDAAEAANQVDGSAANAFRVAKDVPAGQGHDPALMFLVAAVAGVAAALAGLAPLVAMRARRQRSQIDAGFDIIDVDGDFEIRRYEPAVIAEATAAGDRERAFKSCLEALSEYAAGANRDSARIVKSPPLMQTRAGAQWSLEFVVCHSVGVNGAPAPRSARVRVRMQQSRLIAAAAVGGISGAQEFERAVERLRSWANETGYEVVGAPIYAYYGPFWAPALLRRTEVLLNVRQKG